jgi:superfamily II DNA or RNA helicase
MLSIFTLIQNKVKPYIKQEMENNHSLVGSISKYLRTSPLREPQKEAIEVYLWLKFIGRNQKLSAIVKQGLLYDDDRAKEYNYYQIFDNNYILHFLNQFAQDNELKNFQDALVKDPKGINNNWDNILTELLHNFEYPNFLFSLPMGAGKTYLMACFIYLDLYFSKLFPDDTRFANNFVVFAPSASKTAILPALQTIKNFIPEWILPSHEAEKLKQVIHIEILDSLSSKRKDKLHGNNPNLEKVNRLTQTKEFGLVFITNAEKVVLESYSKDDQSLLNSPLFVDEQKRDEIKKTNDLREKLSQIPKLTVILDEVHHTYGTSGEGEKKLRQAVNILNQHQNVICVLGLSGTPYIQNKLEVGDSSIRLNQIQDIVYNYLLSTGIGRFLKLPDIISEQKKESVFIKNALTEFFNKYDLTYSNGTKSKIAFYCPSIKKLNENILPVVEEWYNSNRRGKQDEIFKFYSQTKKEDKKYEIPKESKAIFHNLDKPYSDKRVILLVAVGTEGWDCRSLTAVALPRQKTTKNFVLQTTCRCLREVDNASKEKALIYLSKDNYETLDDELNKNYGLSIVDLKIQTTETIKVKVRKPKLGKLRFNQVYKKYTIVKKSVTDIGIALNSFSLNDFKKAYAYDESVIHGRIGTSGIVSEVYYSYNTALDVYEYEFEDFIYDLSKMLYSRFTESELLSLYEKELQQVYSIIQNDINWISSNPIISIDDVVRHAANLFTDTIEYEEEAIEEPVEIELLEWNLLDANLTFEGGKFVPEFNKTNAKAYGKFPERWEQDFFDPDTNNLDPLNISFNYVPYKMDSDFERNAIYEMLKLAELKNLEVYYNGYSDKNLVGFYIKTPFGIYTPDFLILKRSKLGKYKSKSEKGEIEKVLIIETKADIYYDDEFRGKERFVKDVFVKHNANFKYKCFVDEGKNDFKKHLKEFKELIENL